MAKKSDKRIGRYKLLGELGRGAMGIVYKAEDPNLDRVVALKTIILVDDAAGRKEYQKRFFLEAKAAGKLNHPHIVTTYDFGEENGIAYLAMELLEGKDLRARLQEGALPAAEAVDIAKQVAEGLGYAHERGIVHRDVKPGNIMLLGRGRAKVMDFGLARMRMADHKTSTGMVLGTPKYMSPEQVAGSPVDNRSDIFSLGIVLYEMLTGVRLFAGEDAPQIMHNVTYSEHEPPTRVNPALPAMLDFVVARAEEGCGGALPGRLRAGGGSGHLPRRAARPRRRRRRRRDQDGEARGARQGEPRAGGARNRHRHAAAGVAPVRLRSRAAADCGNEGQVPRPAPARLVPTPAQRCTRAAPRPDDAPRRTRRRLDRLPRLVLATSPRK